MSKPKDDETAAAEHEAQRAAFAKAENRVGRLTAYEFEPGPDGNAPCKCGGSMWFEVTAPDDRDFGRVFACPRCLPQTAIRQAAGRYHPRMIGQVVLEPTAEQMAAF